MPTLTQKCERRWQSTRLTQNLPIVSQRKSSRLSALTAAGLRPLDAAHVAFAEAGACDALITCDDRLIRQAARAGFLIRVMNPLEYVQEVGHVE